MGSGEHPPRESGFEPEYLVSATLPGDLVEASAIGGFASFELAAFAALLDMTITHFAAHCGINRHPWRGESSIRTFREHPAPMRSLRTAGEEQGEGGETSEEMAGEDKRDQEGEGAPEEPLGKYDFSGG